MLEYMSSMEHAESASSRAPLENLEQREHKELLEATETPGLYGDPEKAAEVWHYQGEIESCAVACQEFIAEELLGKDFSYVKMMEYAAERNWFSLSGTRMSKVGNLLEEMGLDVERKHGASKEDLKEVLRSGGKIMVAVNDQTLFDPAYALSPDSAVNHVVEVTGIDERDPENVKVILNDSGLDKFGAAREVQLDAFLAAWAKGNNYMVSAFRPKGGDAS